MFLNSGHSVRFTLWNEKARNFKTKEYEEAEKPAVIAVTSCVVKTYGGKILTLYFLQYSDNMLLIFRLLHLGLQLSNTAATAYYFNPDIPEANEIRAV